MPTNTSLQRDQATRVRPLSTKAMGSQRLNRKEIRPQPATDDHPPPMSLRTGSPEDAARLGEICYEAFKTIAEKHAFPPDFPSPAAAAELMRMMLARADIHAVVAELNGRVVGSNFLWTGGPVAGVGPITISPDVQNATIGRQLMEAVISHARQQEIRAVRLVQAAYHARSLSLYTKLGFVAREPLVVLQGEPLGLRLDGYRVRPATARDVEAASAVCRKVHRHDRTGELTDAIQRGSAVVVEHGGRITGYTTGIGFFGHAVGITTDDLKALIAAATVFDGPGFLLPMRNSDLFRWCLEHGLQVVQPMTLMSMGPYDDPDGPFLPSILF